MELLTWDQVKKNKKILVIGYPLSGKTTLVKSWNVKDRLVVHTDDYIPAYGYEEALYKILSHINFVDTYVVEGVQGYRILRKLSEYHALQPDLVIICRSTQACLPKHRTFRKNLDTVFRKYQEHTKELPRFHIHYTY